MHKKRRKYTKKYSKHPDDPMTLKELEIFWSQEVEISNHPTTKGRRGKTYMETKRELGVGDRTIAKTKQKADYNALARARLLESGYNIDKYIQDLIALTTAEKGANVKGSGRVYDADNVARFNAVDKIGNIFGVEAPKQLDLKHTMVAMSDDELIDAIESSCEGIDNNGNVRREITGSFNAGNIISNTVVDERPSMVESGSQQTVSPTSN